MPIHLRLFLGVFGLFLLVSCSSSKNPNDTDILPDSDINTQDSETIDDSDLQEAEIADDFDEVLDSDSDDEPAEEIFDDTDRINGYKRCYDEIPDEPYEGFFADPKIEIWIRGALHYDWDYEIQEEDLEKVTEIGLPVKDLRGVEKLVNLEYAELLDAGGNVYDFTPLSKLKKLKKVGISSETMTCLDGSFSFLTNLETLVIENTQLQDVSPIEQLVNLKILEMDHNTITFLPRNIRNLQALERLTFSYNKVKDIEFIKSLTNLEVLFFTNNQIEDISSLRNLTKMVRINLSGNNVVDISAIENFGNLKSLGANNNRIKILPDFRQLGKLQHIYLDYNNISNLSNLKGLDSVNEMWLAYNNLNDADFIKLNELEAVGFLDVSFNKFTKIPVLKNVESLYELYLVGNKITDLTGFADNESFPALKNLDVGSNKIENVEAFRNRKGLSILRVDKNCIKDFSPLEELMEHGTHVGGMNEQSESCEDK